MQPNNVEDLGRGTEKVPDSGDSPTIGMVWFSMGRWESSSARTIDTRLLSQRKTEENWV